MVDVTVLGDTNLDLLTEPIDTIPENEQKFIDKIKIKIGGGAANFALASVKLGFETRLISSVGNDFIGNFILNRLKESGIDLHIKKLEVPTGITLGIQLKNGSKKLFTYRSNNKVFSLKHFSLEEIEGDWLQVFGYNLMDGLREHLPKILSYAKEKEMVVGFDPDIKAGLKFDKEEFYRLLKFVDVLFLNEQEAKNFDFNRLKVRTLIIKKGKNGVAAIEKGNKVELSGISTEVKMPTGAGDVFDAAFVHHYFYGYDLRECLEFAQEKAVEYLKNF